MHLAEVIIFYLICFLVGGIPFGALVARTKKINLREIGSGNIGTINVYRALGLRYAIIVFVMDAFKGAIPVLVCQWFYGRGPMVGLAGVISVLGHIFSPYLKFQGGKGVATGFGAMVALSVLPALVCFGVWCGLMFLFRIASIASLVSALLLPILIYAFKQEWWILASAIIIVMAVLLSHYSNLSRLLRGKEKPLK